MYVVIERWENLLRIFSNRNICFLNNNNYIKVWLGYTVFFFYLFQILIDGTHNILLIRLLVDANQKGNEITVAKTKTQNKTKKNDRKILNARQFMNQTKPWLKHPILRHSLSKQRRDNNNNVNKMTGMLTISIEHVTYIRIESPILPH